MGIGSDLDKIGNTVLPEARAGVLGGNWLRFLRGALTPTG